MNRSEPAYENTYAVMTRTGVGSTCRCEPRLRERRSVVKAIFALRHVHVAAALHSHGETPEALQRDES